MLRKIKKLIEKSENPLFFYDDDPDGLVSYLLLRRYFKKGEGVIIRVRGNSVDEEKLYLSKISEYKPDVVVFLDKPTLTQKIFDKINVKKIWIDHHEPVKLKGVVYYNPRLKGKNKPVSYVCYQIVEEDLWLACVGVTSDWNTALVKKFKKKYPELVKGLKVKYKPDDVLYDTELGKLARIFSFVLKGKTKDVRAVVESLLKIKEPYEILEKKSEEGKMLLEKAEKIKKKYDELFKEAKQDLKKERGKVLVFRYFTKEMSFTSDLANELLHEFSDKVIVVGRENDDEMRISLRSGEDGVDLPSLIRKISKSLDLKGGGHFHAAACLIKKDDFEEFVKLVKEEAE